MIELVLLVCLIGDPKDCHEEKLGEAEGGLQACMLAAPIQVAEWSRWNVHYHVTRAICRASSKDT